MLRNRLLPLIKKEVDQPNKVEHDISDFSDFEKEIVSLVKPFTMTGALRIVSLVRSVQYILDNDIQGDFVECGVWKGGSVMAIAEVLKRNNRLDREIYLYDTFEGMPPPQDIDKSYDGKSAKAQLEQSRRESSVVWAYSALEEAKRNVSGVGYPDSKIHFIKGKVEETLQKITPERVALLRLDTDWYESTKVELETLFPKLISGGVIIIDDYGHWEGCRKAVDEYFSSNQIPILLNRIDYTGRIAVKL